MKLVVITQRVDEDDPALGATVAKLRALAPLVDELVVLALAASSTTLPSNVRVLTFGGGTKPVKAARLLRALAAEARPGPVAVLAHMAPIYAVLAAPLTKVRRIPLLLWFTHWRRSPTLRLAERLATTVVTVDPQSFPFRSSKLVPVGHGVDVPARVERHPPGRALRVLALGRTSPAKGLETIAEAARSVDGVELEMRGPSLTPEEQSHREALLRRGVRVEPPVPHSRLAEVLARADVLVNNMRSGALDKVVFEAAAAGLPVLVASEGFDRLVAGIEPPLRFRQDDVGSLADAIRRVRDLGPSAREAVGDELRARVVRDHSVEHWAKAVLEAAART